MYWRLSQIIFILKLHLIHKRFFRFFWYLVTPDLLSLLQELVPGDMDLTLLLITTITRDSAEDLPINLLKLGGNVEFVEIHGSMPKRLTRLLEGSMLQGL